MNSSSEHGWCGKLAYCLHVTSERQRWAIWVFGWALIQEIERGIAIIDYNYRCPKGFDGTNGPCILSSIHSLVSSKTGSHRTKPSTSPNASLQTYPQKANPTYFRSTATAWAQGVKGVSALYYGHTDRREQHRRGLVGVLKCLNPVA